MAEEIELLNNTKFDNQLTYSLGTPQDLREKTNNLNVGFNDGEGVWELIIKYVGDIYEGIRQAGLTKRVKVKPLIGGFGVVTIGREDIERFATIPQVFFIERPTRLSFGLDEARKAVCIPDKTYVDGMNEETDNNLLKENWEEGTLTGEGVIVAIIDSGIDYYHPDFCDDKGNTRIQKLWDQTTDVVYDKSEINSAIMLGRRVGEEIVSQRDLSGHGTHVAGIACGNGRVSGGRYKGIATNSQILVVKLGDSLGDSFPRTTRLLEALDYVVKIAIEENKPIAINLSFGNNYGTHSGDSLVVSYINNICRVWKTSVIIGTGNEGNSKVHTTGRISNDIEIVEFNIGDYEGSINLQIWRNYYDEFDIYMVFPNNSAVKLNETEAFIHNYEDTVLLIYNSMPGPISGRVETFIEFIPTEMGYINAGLYKLYLVPRNVVTGEYNMWFPVSASISENTGFINPVNDTTLTIPSTSSLGISVGAYNSNTMEFAEFSGRGPIAGGGYNKPDLVAPGVDIISCSTNGSYTVRSGTSMAAPFVTGAAALLMEYGIIKGNDPYLFGQKLKTYLLKGARQLKGEVTPSYKTGYGALCIRDSLP
ncbi:MAG: S8 family serine peptidase [Lachnospiraceae bacterium]|nr:S8 family serine peptidase [Lachnospiraceae bacterium]